MAVLPKGAASETAALCMAIMPAMYCKMGPGAMLGRSARSNMTIQAPRAAPSGRTPPICPCRCQPPFLAYGLRLSRRLSCAPYFQRMHADLKPCSLQAAVNSTGEARACQSMN